MVYEQKLQFLELLQPFSCSQTDPYRQLAKLRYQSGITSANEVITVMQHKRTRLGTAPPMNTSMTCGCHRALLRAV